MFGLLVYKAFSQIEDYITVDVINLADVLTLITILETAFGDPDRVTTVKRKLEAHKQTNPDFSTSYVEFSYYATNV
jgi:hypothetical protein